jgi:hypothetical protein
MTRGFRRLGPLTDDDYIPGKITMWKCGRAIRHSAGSASIVLKDHCRERRSHPIGVLDNCRDGFV